MELRTQVFSLFQTICTFLCPSNCDQKGPTAEGLLLPLHSPHQPAGPIHSGISTHSSLCILPLPVLSCNFPKPLETLDVSKQAVEAYYSGYVCVCQLAQYGRDWTIICLSGRIICMQLSSISITKGLFVAIDH